MAQNISKDNIKNIVSESLQELVIRKQVERVVSESLQEVIKNKIDEASKATIKRFSPKSSEKKKAEKSGMTQNKYKSVMNSLKDDSLNHAQLMRDLWHPSDKKKEDELRSLFSKMATGTPDADGVVRHFTPDEINKLYELIRGIGK
nr:MAG TPA: Flagellar M-ring protein, Flagellar motor motor, MS-ring, C-ring, MOTOR.3A [Bacteriophage sp.]